MSPGLNAALTGWALGARGHLALALEFTRSSNCAVACAPGCAREPVALVTLAGGLVRPALTARQKSRTGAPSCPKANHSYIESRHSTNWSNNLRVLRSIQFVGLQTAAKKASTIIVSGCLM